MIQLQTQPEIKGFYGYSTQIRRHIVTCTSAQSDQGTSGCIAINPGIVQIHSKSKGPDESAKVRSSEHAINSSSDGAISVYDACTKFN